MQGRSEGMAGMAPQMIFKSWPSYLLGQIGVSFDQMCESLECESLGGNVQAAAARSERRSP